MLLQILVPQYKETDEIVKPLLDSIKMQQNVDFNDIGVIITNDGSDIFLSEELIRSYPFNIQYFKNEHKGVSATRNFCLDKATANYVMFCDADDLFMNSLGLQLVMNSMRKESLDVITSTFMEELKTDKGMVYIDRQQDSVFVHGKIYNRNFLNYEKIRWGDDLLIHEDSYFNGLALALARNKKYCETPFYLWHWNQQSVSRTNKYYVIETYDHLLKSATKLSHDLLEHGKKQESAQMFCLNMFQTFYIMSGMFFELDDTKAIVEKLNPLAAKFYQDFNELFKALTPAQIFQIRNNARTAAIEHGWYKERFTFNDWIKYIFESAKQQAALNANPDVVKK